MVSRYTLIAEYNLKIVFYFRFGSDFCKSLNHQHLAYLTCVVEIQWRVPLLKGGTLWKFLGKELMASEYLLCNLIG